MYDMKTIKWNKEFEKNIYILRYLFIFLKLYFYFIQSKIQINIQKDGQNFESRSTKINLRTCPKNKLIENQASTIR